MKPLEETTKKRTLWRSSATKLLCKKYWPFYSVCHLVRKHHCLIAYWTFRLTLGHFILG